MSFDPMTIRMKIDAHDISIPMTLSGNTNIIPGNTALWKKLLTKTLAKLDDDMIPDGITSLPDYIFQFNENLSQLRTEQITSVGDHTFYSCGITDFYMPNLKSASTFAFSRNPFESVEFPNLEIADQFVLAECENLKRVDFSSLTEIKARAFYGCSNLDTIIFRNNFMVPFSGNSPYQGTKIESGTGYFYVKKSLLDQYLNNNGWEFYKNQLRTIEDYSL